MNACFSAMRDEAMVRSFVSKNIEGYDWMGWFRLRGTDAASDNLIPGSRRVSLCIFLSISR